MGDEPHNARSEDDELQFEQAEYADADGAEPGPTACGACGMPLEEDYYEVNAATVCPRCAEELRAAMTGGSGAGRFARATAYGVLAAAAGGAIWYGIRAATGYEIGLIAIVVGLMVGLAVRKGAARRGGWLYQTLAVLLTYCSVAATWVPQTIQAWQETPPPELATTTSAPVEVDVQGQTGGAEDPNLALAIPSWDELGPAGKMLAAAACFVLCFVILLPAMIGSGDIIGLLIIGFAFYEAWKLNKRVPLAIDGPYAVAASGSDESTSTPDHHGSQ